MAFDSRLCNTITNLAVGVPLDVMGVLLSHAGFATTSQHVYLQVAPGSPEDEKAQEAMGLLASCGIRFQVLLHAQWSTIHLKPLQHMAPDDLRAHFAPQAPTGIWSWLQPAMACLSMTRVILPHGPRAESEGTPTR